MTREEFLTQFTTLTSAATPDVAALTTFRDNVLKDYDDSASTATTNKTLTTKVAELEKANADLRDANFRMYMATVGGSAEQNDKGKPTPATPPVPKPNEPTITPDEGIDALNNALLGIKKGE